MKTIKFHAEDIQVIEEKASDLVGAIASIKAIAFSNPEHVVALLTALEMAVQSVQTDLYQLRTIRQA
jgi:hypothetical protein